MVGYRLLIILFFLSIGNVVNAQESVYKYVVFFTDKHGSVGDIDKPSTFLSSKAIERRAKFNIPVLINDLPVSATYIENIEDKGFKYISQSRWLNAILIESETAISINNLLEESYIKNVLFAATYLEGGKSEVSVAYNNMLYLQQYGGQDYGVATRQIDLLNGQFLHDEGWNGEDMIIAVLDAGFRNVQKVDAFQNIYEADRLVATFDMVEYDDDVYESSGHGTAVLSILTGKIDNQFLGVAPAASYILLRTEDVGSEQLVEEYNYVLGLEFAEQYGVDVVNTSLGYTRFNHPEMDHNTSDLDGDHLIASVGADIAASKGILVTNSAGNLGNNDWQYISFPSDGDSVLAIGAVDAYGSRTAFSGMGNPVINGVKPNVMGMGSEVAVINEAGEIRFGDGTSFSGPTVAGLAACLWQAFPEKSNMEILRAIEQSSSQFLNPDNQMGYGIPDFQAAYSLLYQEKYNLNEDLADISVFPNPFYNSISLTLPFNLKQSMQVSLVNDMGQQLYTQNIPAVDRLTFNLEFPNLTALKMGIYFLQIKTNDEVFMFKMIKV